MKHMICVLIFLLTCTAVSEVAEDSKWMEDALIISDLIETQMTMPCLVSLAGPDSALVAFVSLGGEWTASEENWYDFMVVCAVTSGVDMEKPWDILDVVVSFGDSWCAIPMEDIFQLSDLDISEDEWWEELKVRTEVHP